MDSNGKPARRKLCKTCKRRKQFSRERCRACLTHVWTRIDAGDLTLREAEDQGLLSPSKKSGRKAIKRRKLAKSTR